MSDHHEPLLSLDRVTKRFGGITAIDSLSLELPTGVIGGVIGPNGAGKTTLFNLVTGVFPLSGGTILFEGVPLAARHPHTIARRGIARTFQLTRLFRTMTVEEHLTLAHGFGNGHSSGPWRRARQRQRRREVDEIFELTRLGDVRDRLAVELPYGHQRRVEIARALATGARLLLLDEPAAGMNPAETVVLSELIRALPERGHTVLLIEHDMPFVMSLCAHLWVLNFGSLIATGSPDDVRKDARVIEAYLGQEAWDAA